MEKQERLKLAIAQAEIAVRLLAEGQSVAEVAETCDIPVAIVEALNKRLDKAEEDGFDRGMVASFLTALIKRK
jgi:pyruvate/2-oxoglutarate dehydrogenase complex dihydrolipoamide acyltransferase (E2) component